MINRFKSVKRFKECVEMGIRDDLFAPGKTVVSADTMSDNTSLFTSTEASISSTENYIPPLLSKNARDIILLINYCILGHIIAFLGIGANVINIVVFFKMGFSETINISLFGLSFADLMCLITNQWIYICFNPLISESKTIDFNPEAVAMVLASWPHIAFTRVTGVLTVYVTFERCMCVILPIKIKDLFTPKRTSFAIVVIFALILSTLIPVYSVLGLEWIHDPFVNRSRLGYVTSDNYFEVEGAVWVAQNVISFLTFALVVVFNVILALNLRNKARWREGMSQGSAEDKARKSALSKERKIVMTLIMISTVFIVCFTPINVAFITIMVVPNLHMFGPYKNLNQVIFSVGSLLETVNSSINMLIYLKMSSRYRMTFKRMLGFKATESASD